MGFLSIKEYPEVKKNMLRPVTPVQTLNVNNQLTLAKAGTISSTWATTIARIAIAFKMSSSTSRLDPIKRSS